MCQSHPHFTSYLLRSSCPTNSSLSFHSGRTTHLLPCPLPVLYSHTFAHHPPSTLICRSCPNEACRPTSECLLTPFFFHCRCFCCLSWHVHRWSQHTLLLTPDGFFNEMNYSLLLSTFATAQIKATFLLCFRLGLCFHLFHGVLIYHYMLCKRSLGAGN